MWALTWGEVSSRIFAVPKEEASQDGWLHTIISISCKQDNDAIIYRVGHSLVSQGPPRILSLLFVHGESLGTRLSWAWVMIGQAAKFGTMGGWNLINLFGQFSLKLQNCDTRESLIMCLLSSSFRRGCGNMAIPIWQEARLSPCQRYVILLPLPILR